MTAPQTVALSQFAGVIDSNGYFSALLSPNGKSVPLVAVNGATASVSNIASLRSATSASLTATAVNTLGYYLPGDGGSGLYSYVSTDTTTADNGGSVIVDASNRRWYLQTNYSINVLQFGATGNGTTDDTNAIQAAINVGRLSNPPQIVYFPQGIYKITASLNCTSNTLETGFGLIGDGRFSTIITAVLSAAYPVLDCTGMWYPRIEGLSVRSASGSASCGILIAASAADTSSSNFSTILRELEVQITNSSAVACVVINNGDLAAVEDCYLSAGACTAMACGTVLPSGIASAYQTISSVQNQTDYRFFNTWFTGKLPFDWNGGLGATFISCYAATTGTQNSDNCAMRFQAPSATATKFEFFNLRIECQASGNPTSFYPIYFKGTNIQPLQVEMYGSTLNMAASNLVGNSACFKYDQGSNTYSLIANVYSNNGIYPVCNITGNMGHIGGSSNIIVDPVVTGTVGTFDHYSTYGHSFLTFLNSHLSQGGRATDSDVVLIPTTSYQLGVVGAAAQPAGYNFAQNKTVTTYTSGTMTVESYKIPANILLGYALCARTLRLLVRGKTTGANVTVTVNVRQGANTWSLGNTGVITASGTVVAIDMLLNNVNAGATNAATSALVFGGEIKAGLAVVASSFSSAPIAVYDVTQDGFVDVQVNAASFSTDSGHGMGWGVVS